jgi:2-oxoisovalerate dehydrogenase E1 component beta subunit
MFPPTCSPSANSSARWKNEEVTDMAQMNMIQALNSALNIMLSRDPGVIVIGQDVGFFGGVFRVTDGLQRQYGEHRVIDTPIAEGGIVGSAIGMGVNGLRPVAEIQFADYIYPGCDQIISELARLRYRTGGDFFAPVTIRTPCGGGIRGGQTHSQSPEGIFTHVCGLKVVMPSNPYDAKGLLISAIEDDDPVIFFEPKRIYNGPFDGDADKPAVPWSTHPKGEVPEDYYTIPIGRAEVIRPGSEVTILCYGTMVHVCAAAAEAAEVDAEIIDVRTMAPLDVETLKTSVEKTGRCVIAHEATRFSGYGAELAATVSEECFYHLEAPIQRVAGWDTPYPHAFEWEYFPGQKRVAAALERVLEAP